MRPIVPAAALLAVVGGVALFAYAVIRPALFIVILSSMALAGFFACLSPEMRLRVGRAPIILALGLPLAAWLMPNIWLLYAVMLVAVPLLARNPGQIAPLYLFALLLLPALNLTIVAGSLKLFEVGVNEFLATGAAFALAIRPGKARIPRALDLPLIALVLLLVIATTRSTSITNFFRVLVSGVLDCALPYYIVSRGVRSVDDLKLCMIHLAAAASVLSMILLYEAHSSWPMYNILYDHYGIVERLMVKLRGGVLRASGPFLESTSMAMVLSSCILATWLSRSAFRSKWHHLAVLALLFAGLTAPQSRGAWMGLLIGILVADAYRRRIGAAIRRVMLIGVMVAALVAVAPLSPYLSDTLGLSEGSASTVDYRQRLFDRGMEEFWKSPIVGYSPPDILARLDDMRQGEGIIDFVNTYIYFALVSGIIGLIVFVVSFLTYLMLLWRDRRFVRANDPDGEAFALVFAGLVMPMEMLVFTSFGGRPEIFVFVFFAFASAIVSMRKQAQRIETPWPLLWSDVQRPDTQIRGTSIALTP